MTYFSWYILPVIVAILIAAYLCYTVFRGVKYFGKKFSLKKQLIITAIISIICIGPAVNIYSVWFIVLIHMAVLLLLSDLIAWVVRKVRKKKHQNFLKAYTGAALL